MSKKLKVIIEAEFDPAENPEMADALRTVEKLATESGLEHQYSVEVVDYDELHRRADLARQTFAILGAKETV